MEKFATFIVVIFLYAGVRWLLAGLVTNTAAGVQLSINIVPLIIAVVVVAFLVKLL